MLIWQSRSAVRSWLCILKVFHCHVWQVNIMLRAQPFYASAAKNDYWVYTWLTEKWTTSQYDRTSKPFNTPFASAVPYYQFKFTDKSIHWTNTNQTASINCTTTISGNGTRILYRPKEAYDIQSQQGQATSLGSGSSTLDKSRMGRGVIHWRLVSYKQLSDGMSAVFVGIKIYQVWHDPWYTQVALAWCSGVLYW